MSNQSPFVKIVIWFMVFLMSVGFVALVIAPFAGTSLFGAGDGRDATKELRSEAAADVRKDDCTNPKDKPTGKRLERCRDALDRLGSAYQSLAAPVLTDDGLQELPKDSQRNADRALDAYKASYQLDTTHVESAERYAGFLMGQGKASAALPIWTALVKAEAGNEDYLLNLAVAQRDTSAYDTAIATLRSFIKKFPESGQVESAKELITSIQEQQKQAASGAAGAGNISLPTSLG